MVRCTDFHGAWLPFFGPEGKERSTIGDFSPLLRLLSNKQHFSSPSFFLLLQDGLKVADAHVIWGRQDLFPLFIPQV